MLYCQRNKKQQYKISASDCESPQEFSAAALFPREKSTKKAGYQINGNNTYGYFPLIQLKLKEKKRQQKQ